MTTDYRAEIDVFPELNATDDAYYQSLIGVVRWMVELGQVDICTEVSMLSSMLGASKGRTSNATVSHVLILREATQL